MRKYTVASVRMRVHKCNLEKYLKELRYFFSCKSYFGKILAYRVDSIFLLIQYRNKASFLLIIRMLIGKFNA